MANRQPIMMNINSRYAWEFVMFKHQNEMEYHSGVPVPAIKVSCGSSDDDDGILDLTTLFFSRHIHAIFTTHSLLYGRQSPKIQNMKYPRLKSTRHSRRKKNLCSLEYIYRALCACALFFLFFLFTFGPFLFEAVLLYNSMLSRFHSYSFLNALIADCYNRQDG